MAKFYMFFGTQAYEFERPDIPDPVVLKGIKANINKSKYSLNVKSSTTKEVLRMFVIKQGDTLPMLEAQLFDPDGNPLNLDLCGVRFYMKNRYLSDTINKQASIKDIENGIVQVIWEDGDTSKAGVYKCEFEVNMPDGNTITVPNDDYFLIKIVRELS